MLLICGLTGSLFAQTASEVCLVEVETAFQQVDAQQLLASGKATRFDYRHVYTMRADPEQKVVDSYGERMYADNLAYHDSPDALEVTNGKEAFNVRKQQFVIYRTKSSLKKAAMIPLADAGLFQHCTVRECHFIPSEKYDTLSYKRAYLTVNAEGQKKYQIENLEFITNPLDTTLISVTVNFTARSQYKNASYTIRSYEQGGAGMEVPESPAALILRSDGSLNDDFKGYQLMDYR